MQHNIELFVQKIFVTFNEYFYFILLSSKLKTVIVIVIMVSADILIKIDVYFLMI